MSRDKQVEEMAKVIGDADQRCYEMVCDDCPLHDMELGLCKEKFIATDLYENGYRKSSEVAIILTRAEKDALNEYSEKIKKLGAKDATEV